MDSQGDENVSFIFNHIRMDFKNSSLLAKPIWQMTGEEFLQLNELTRTEESSESAHAYAYGIGELSKMIGCCQSTVYALKKQGVLDDAIVSNIGRRIIFDVETARKLADDYQRAQRLERKEER